MAGSAWTNQLVNLIILSASQQGFSGFFVYSPAPGPGNLIGSWAAAAGTDPYGNAYPAGLSVDVGSFTGVSLFLYSGPPAAGSLIVSIASTAGTDSFGNNYLAGIATYSNSTGIATALAAGFVAFYSGSLSGGWSALSSVSGDGSGNLQVNAGGQLQLVGSGGVTINGSSNTSTNGLADGTIHGTSGAASAGTAHTHSPGSFAVGSGQHNHTI